MNRFSGRDLRYLDRLCHLVEGKNELKRKKNNVYMKIRARLIKAGNWNNVAFRQHELYEAYLNYKDARRMFMYTNGKEIKELCKYLNLQSYYTIRKNLKYERRR